jgi:hypothetical protein
VTPRQPRRSRHGTSTAIITHPSAVVAFLTSVAIIVCVGADLGESSLRGFLRVVAQAVRVAVSARRAHSGPNGPLKTPAWGWRAPGLSFDRRTTPVVGARLPLPCGALDSPSRRSAAGCGCALGCQRSARRDVGGRAVLSATGRSGPEPSAWGRVTTSARLSFDRRSTAAPGLTPDGEGGGGEGGRQPTGISRRSIAAACACPARIMWRDDDQRRYG